MSLAFFNRQPVFGINRLCCATDVSQLVRIARSVSGRDNCSPVSPPKCSPENLSKTPCGEEKKKDEKAKPKSMWYNPDCCIDPCPDVLPRFDDLYYKPSDKATRKYQVTWVECPKLFIAPRKICCFDETDLPLVRRKKHECPKTACEDPCAGQSDKKCPKLRMPGCKRVRDILKCKIERPPSNCVKVCCPYPSFSECIRDRPKPRRPVECNCLQVPDMCDVWEKLRRLSPAN